MKEWLTVFGAAVVGAGAGVTSTLLILRAKGREARSERRRAIRAALVKFDEVVRNLGWGGWPAGTSQAWAPEHQKVLALRRQVVEAVDLDRATAGKWWCRRVGKCLEAGWKLVTLCTGMSTGVLRGDPQVMMRRLKEHQRTYTDSYEAVQ